MQLYAFDLQGNLTYARNANRQVNYACPECNGVVRARGGLHRRDHFYHIETQRVCRQNGKSGEHLAVQWHLLDVLPEGECRLECPFPSIGRIADVVWEPKKIVFEVQCASITAAEVKERNRDYASLGYEVIWILHDQRYNKRRMSAMEIWLYEQPHYFTNIQEDGKGLIYDQFSTFNQMAQRTSLSPLPIDPSNHKLFLNPMPSELSFFAKRIRNSRGYFTGDLIDLASQGDHFQQYLSAARQLIEENTPLSQKRSRWQYYLSIILKPYCLALQFILEKCSK
jgi:competence protein CoiA